MACGYTLKKELLFYEGAAKVWHLSSISRWLSDTPLPYWLTTIKFSCYSGVDCGCIGRSGRRPTAWSACSSCGLGSWAQINLIIIVKQVNDLHVFGHFAKHVFDNGHIFRFLSTYSWRVKGRVAQANVTLYALVLSSEKWVRLKGREGVFDFRELVYTDPAFRQRTGWFYQFSWSQNHPGAPTTLFSIHLCIF